MLELNFLFKVYLLRDKFFFNMLYNIIFYGVSTMGFFITLPLVFLFIFFSPSASSSTAVNIELGYASTAYNKVRIDGVDGTLFNLSPALDTTSYHRLSVIKKIKSSTGMRFLYAPLKFSGDKLFSKDINFNGVNFPAGKRIDVEYKFNSYRATYFYEILSRSKMILRLGGTLKVRDALVELKQDDRRKFKKNTGVVPLLYLYAQYRLGNNVILTFDFDGLAAPQGRAVDVALMAGYQFTPLIGLHLGSRMLEGGADNEKVYNFSQINYYFTALELKF